MPKMIQIRHVPDALHRRLKQRATAQGMSLSEYLKRELEQVAEWPSWEEAFARLDALEPVRSDESSVEMVHAARAERDAQLAERLGLPPE